MSNTDTKVEYAKGSWQEALQRSSLMLDRSAKARKLASSLLWKGATDGIADWLGTDADTDTTGENLYGVLLEALGTSRKGDASKIRSVAVAVRDHGLDLGQFENLAKAYGQAVHLTKTVKTEKTEDDAAEEAIAAIEAPKSTSSVDGAAALLLSRGVDGAVVAILDALGTDNFAAHRAFLRSVSGEINSREQAKRDAEAAAKKAEADAKREAADKERAEKKAEADKAKAAKAKTAKGTKASAKKATAPKTATTKAKPAGTKATPVKATPVEDAPAEGEAPVRTAKKAIPVRRK